MTAARGLFVYGSLCFDEVLTQLLGRVPAQTPWSLDGWRVASLCDRPYPGLVAELARRAAGAVLTDLTADEWQVLDEYEGPQYERTQVGRLDGVSVDSYVWLEPGLVEPTDWDRDDFRRRLLPNYVAELYGVDQRSERAAPSRQNRSRMP
ncbi:gamma-glutamylcyclotransferase family protein [Angustibacter sp. McL0619]|uniref:gamma-glutamylcyclotransferase family protein n=1 Tax=Angustibacter sp. McL0619 TaxID=3415676 RepID=UPI003CF08772